MIDARNLTRTYSRGDGATVTALRDVSLAVTPGEFVVIRGASGSGKSSLLNILGCLDTPTSGTYRLGGEDVSQLGDDERSGIRSKRLGFVFQSFNLMARTTALENVELPALYTDAAPDRSRALALLERVGLGDRSGHLVTELSGGQQQRVAIARALMNDPPLLLADEPTGNLDSAAAASILRLLTEVNRDGRTIVLVTHDADVAACARREIVITDGRIASDRPQTPREPSA